MAHSSAIPGLTGPAVPGNGPRLIHSSGIRAATRASAPHATRLQLVPAADSTLRRRQTAALRFGRTLALLRYVLPHMRIL